MPIVVASTLCLDVQMLSNHPQSEQLAMLRDNASTRKDVDRALTDKQSILDLARDQAQFFKKALVRRILRN